MRRLDLEPFLDAIHHDLGGVHLVRAVCGRGLDVEDDAGLGVDQVVGRIGVKRRAAGRGRPLRGRVGERHVLRRLTRFLCGVQRFQVLAYRARERRLPVPAGIAARDTALAVCVGLDDAGIDGEAFASDQALSQAALQHLLEHEAQRVAVAEPSMPVL